MLGTLSETHDGRLVLRSERRLAHPRETVWRAVTDKGQLRGWFAHILDYDRAELDFQPGAKLAFVPKQEQAAVGTGHGIVSQVDPPRLLEYTWDSETLRFELEPDGDAGCRLVFTNIFDDREAADALNEGWNAGLDDLEALLNRRHAVSPL